MKTNFKEFPYDDKTTHILLPERFESIDKPVTAIVIGAGRRGYVYGQFASQYAQQFDIIGVAEPNLIRNQRYASTHHIEPENCFSNWEAVFERPRFADAVIISSPDRLHVGPCLAALKAGYHVLLEKPIAPSEEECRQILQASKESGKIVAVCHVLRYAPYFRKLRSLIRSGAIGELISIQHMEPIEHVHMAHSYVRGNWKNSATTTPIILAKASHDLDILRWLVGKPCKSVHAFGGLRWFKEENAPEGSTARCTDGCKIEAECPYSAIRIYHQQRERTYVFDLPEDKEEQGDYILQQLRTTDYGRCVYRMDNDQPDHYVANLLFDGGVTASFSLQAFTSYEGRRTRVMGSHGDIEGDMTKMVITSFQNGQKEQWAETTDLHGGGDFRLMADFVMAVHANDPTMLTSTLEASIESHLMGFAAEKSRMEELVVPIIC
ncbi:Gfo/Idh/MocA family protein [Flavihumibacter sp. UBA7668]|uniref:Gfo/Idh/MocA family protein n=1 Tax=Flavihumibacter sp. UBA7668 TaxID=1946542 RepID=UPI0025C2D647|nr:Gfo/Idh/MocA family oxidoreductase [Flavihumibacter sp. UBA7668]